MLTNDPKKRFSDRVDAYARYRPGYPREVIGLLRTECGLTPDSIVADIGSGTGLLAQLFLENGNTVYGVEPNDAMRHAGEAFLKDHPKFHSVAGSAEDTALPDATVGVVTAGQAYHWFDPARAREEFERISKPPGWVALVWNERKLDTSPFARDYENLLRTYGTDYEAVAANYPKTSSSLAEFFGRGRFAEKDFPSSQAFDYDGLRGRLMSSSYVPQSDQPTYGPMIAELRRIFDAHQRNGRISFEYQTRVFYGCLHAASPRDAGTQ